MIRKAAFILALIWCTRSASAQTPITLAELEQMALQSHPSLLGASAAVEAAKRDTTQAGAWPNPSISYVGDEIAGGPINRGGEHGVLIDQTIPLGGKLKFSRQALEAGVTEAEARRDRDRLVVLARVRTAFYEVQVGQLRVAIREGLSALTQESSRVSSQLFNVGVVDRPDVLTMEMEATVAGLDLVEARNSLTRAWKQLAAAVSQPGLPVRPVAGDANSPLPALSRDEALSAALAASPDLAEARARAMRAEREVDLAKKVTAPELLLKGGPRYNRELLEPSNQPVGLEWSIEAGVTLPLWNRNSSGVAAATSRVAEAKASASTIELQLIDRFAALYADYETARERAEAYRKDVLPKAEEAHKLYLARYGEMAASYPQVLMAQRALLEANERFLAAVERVRASAVEIGALLLER